MCWRRPSVPCGVTLVEPAGEKREGPSLVGWPAGGMGDVFWGQRLRWGEDCTPLCCPPPPETFVLSPQNLRFQNQRLRLGIRANAHRELVANLLLTFLKENASALRYLSQNHLPQESCISHRISSYILIIRIYF